MLPLAIAGAIQIPQISANQLPLPSGALQHQNTHVPDPSDHNQRGQVEAASGSPRVPQAPSRCAIPTKAPRINHILVLQNQLCEIAASGQESLVSGEQRNKTANTQRIQRSVADLIGDSGSEVHFGYIEQQIRANESLLVRWQKWTAGEVPDRGTINDLAIIGICRRDAPFRNRIYQRVFGHRGTLSLFDSDSSLTTKDLFPYDVFLSYSSKDNAVVRELAERLRRDGVRVWFDGWELRPGDNILAAIEDGLEHSRVLVLCMSAHAFGADWAQLEAGTFRFRDPLNADRRFLPLRLDDAPIKSALAQFLYINWLPQNRERGYAELLDALEWEKGVVRAEMSTGLNPSEERFLHLDHRPLIGEPVTEGNPISRHFGQLVQSVYSEEHFPRGMDAYKQEEVAYYVHDRITLSEYDGSPGPSPRSVF